MGSQKVISNIRVLTQEMITNAKSGHPGVALGATNILHTLYSKVIKVCEKDDKWFNRDRFVIACGHASSLYYAILHMYGFNISLDDLKAFRKLNSITPGHPEYKHTPGVDSTSGPLGQGIAISVGMAISSAFLTNKYNKDDIKLFDNYTYCLCGDGDLQEGVTLEAMSLAGKLKLNKLIVIYDSNDIQLDGKVSDCNSENTEMKVRSVNFNYFKVEDGDNTEELLEKINLAKASDKPSLIEVKTVIGKTSKLEGTCDVHGAPLKEDEVNEMRSKIGGKPFEIFKECYESFDEIKKHNQKLYESDMKLLKMYSEKYPDEYNELKKYYENNDTITKEDLEMPFDETYNKATRVSAGAIMKKISQMCPVILGGSADLSKSTNVYGADGKFGEEKEGRNILYGVREHAMSAISNGIALNGITKAFCSGFFAFSDYSKGAMRMSSLMGLPVMYFFSHDSIAVGEDGPTHQPIEQLTMLRATPNLNVCRPCSNEEVKEVICSAYNLKDTPSVIVLSRQGLSEVRTLENSKENLSEKGAYIISKEQKQLDAVIIATGSEVELSIKCQERLLNDGIDVRVVSMPSMFLFDKQSEEYKKQILPDDVLKISIEMSESAHMYKYVKDGKVIGINEFGVSSKASDVLDYFGFTVDKMTNLLKETIKK